MAQGTDLIRELCNRAGGRILLLPGCGVTPANARYVLELSGCREVHHTMAGCTIASHCGPKCLGVLFIDE